MNKSSILIIDDHPAMRHGLALLISREPDLEVCAEAGSKDEAMAALAGNKPHMAIVDISLQESKASGIDLIRDIHVLAGPIPVLIISMHEHRSYIEQAFKAGADGYLTKQAPVNEIMRAVRLVLSGEKYFPKEFFSSGDLRGFDAQDLLSEREFEVLRLIGRGFPAREIAKSLYISAKTVESHKLNIKKKLGLQTISEMTRFAIQRYGKTY